jgi:glutamate 5-kinase
MRENLMREELKKAKRVVVKMGTSGLTTPNGNFSKAALERFSQEILSLWTQKKEVVIVSSGAIGLGMEVIGFKSRPKNLSSLQACAATGQGKLMQAYENFFSKRGVHTAQILLTREGIAKRERFLLASQTLLELIKHGLIPIVNENDTVSTEEITFGDNDRLSVHIAHLVHADLLIILSDVDGFFLKDGTRVHQVYSKEEIKNELVKHVKDRYKEKNVGGMTAKLVAAEAAMDLGIPMMMVNGRKKNILEDVLSGKDVGTFFCSSKKKRSAREMWISFSAPKKGTLVVDEGAKNALSKKQVSLLPSGILQFKGQFLKGDVVEVVDLKGSLLARGIVRYSSQNIKKIMGRKTAEIKNLLGDEYHEEVIHRNDLVHWD